MLFGKSTMALIETLSSTARAHENSQRCDHTTPLRRAAPCKRAATRARCALPPFQIKSLIQFPGV